MIYINTNVVQCEHKEEKNMNMNFGSKSDYNLDVQPRTNEHKQIAHIPPPIQTERSNPHKMRKLGALETLIMEQRVNAQMHDAPFAAEQRCILNYNYPYGHSSITNNKLQAKTTHIKPNQKTIATTLEIHKTTYDETFKLWIHCNYCFEPYVKKRRTVHLLSCHHIFCENCLIEAPSIAGKHRYTCKMCAKSVSRMQINNDMPRHIKELFHPKPWTEELLLPRIYNFQLYHRQHLNSAMFKIKIILEKYQTKDNQLDEIIVTALKKRRCLKITLARLMRKVRAIAACREREKAKIEYQKHKKLQFSEDFGSGAQRCYGVSRTRGALRGRSPTRYVTNRNFTNQPFLPFMPEAKTNSFDL